MTFGKKKEKKKKTCLNFYLVVYMFAIIVIFTQYFSFSFFFGKNIDRVLCENVQLFIKRGGTFASVKQLLIQYTYTLRKPLAQ